MKASTSPACSRANAALCSRAWRMSIDSPWRLACSRSSRSEVVPAVTTTRLPPRSAKSRMGLLRCVIKRVCATKIDTENAACRARSRVWVVEPHSRSTVPFWTRAMRFCEVSGNSLTVSAGSFSSLRMRSTTRIISSCE